MSKPRYYWWPYAKAMVKAYPELKREYESIHQQRITQSIISVSGCNCLSRTTEQTAIRQLPPARQREYDAVTKAIEQTKLRSSADERIALIDLVLWKQSHNIEGAAIKLHISDITARRYHRDFIQLVGFCYGLEDFRNS